MTLTQQQRDQITLLLETWYQNKYGNEWRANFHKNMRPSPVQEWAQLHGVSVKDIQQLKFELIFKYEINLLSTHL